MQKIVVGDPHTNHVGVQSILQKSDYNPDIDMLIFTGDYIDGFQDGNASAKKTIELMISLKQNNENVYFIIGNHDLWMLEWIEARDIFPQPLWYYQGGSETLQSYGITERVTYESTGDLIPESHITFLKKLPGSYIDDNIVVVHGGFSSSYDMKEALHGNITHELLWNRTFYKTTYKELLKSYQDIFGDKVFICGHTPYGPDIHYDPPRILIDGGSNGGGKLYAIILKDDNGIGQIISE